MKRIWMLFLVLTALAVFMATPALAAEGTGCLCGSSNGNHVQYMENGKLVAGCDGTALVWTAWGDEEIEKTTLPTESGNYYLTDNVMVAATTTITGDVVLDLNNRTVSVKSGTYCKIISLSGDASLVITDNSADKGGTITGGTGTGNSNKASDQGGNIRVDADSTLTLICGTVSNGRGRRGGNVFLQGKLYMLGGTITGGAASAVQTNGSLYTGTNEKGWGGNIDIDTTGTFLMTAGEITDGYSKGNGGNLRTASSGELKILGGTISGGTSGDQGGNLAVGCDSVLRDCTISGGTAAKGGSFMINAAAGKTVTLQNVTIENGQWGGTGTNSANASGANLRVTGGCDLYIKSGTTITGGASTVAPAARNVFINAAAKVYIDGDTELNTDGVNIAGGVHIANADATVEVSGKVIVYDANAEGQLSVNGNTLTVGKMADGSNVCLDGEIALAAAEGVTLDYTDKQAFTCAGDSTKVALIDGQLQLVDATSHIHCICGGDLYTAENRGVVKLPDGTVYHTCEDITFDVLTEEVNLGDASGNYYLADNLDTTEKGQIGINNKNVRLCLNGKNITFTSTDGTRMFYLNGGTDFAVTSCCEDSFDENGALTNNTIKADWTHNNQNGAIITMTTDATTFSMYRVTVDGSECELGQNIVSGNEKGGKHGIVVYFNEATTFNQFSGTIIGGTTTKTTGMHGGAICVNNADAAYKMYGGVIRDGNAGQWGGNVAVQAGTFYMYGGSIYGGKIKGSANSAYANMNLRPGTELIMSGGSIAGRVNVTNLSGQTPAAQVILSGNPVIDDDTTYGYIQLNSNSLKVGKMASDANIRIKTSNDSARVFAETENGTIPYGYKGCFGYYDDRYDVIRTEDGKLSLVTAGGHVHCICGGSLFTDENLGEVTLPDGTTHSCTDVVFTAASALPTDAVTGTSAIFLNSADDTITATAGVNVKDGGKLVLCLNGKNVLGKTNTRVFVINSTTASEATVQSTLVITSCVKDVNNSEGRPTNNRIIPNYTTQIGHQGGGVWLNDNGHLDMYAGAFDGSQHTSYNTGALISLRRGNASMNMYGGTLMNGQGITKPDDDSKKCNGGNLAVNTNTSMNMYGGVICDGQATNYGGNVFVTGTMKIYGGTITGGTINNGNANQNKTANVAINYGTDASGRATEIYGGQIDGYVSALTTASTKNAATIKLSGAPTITGGDTNLLMHENTTLILDENLSKDASVEICYVDAEDGQALAVDIPEKADTTGITYGDDGWRMIRDGGVLYITKPMALINNAGQAYGLQEALDLVEEGSYVALTADYSGRALELTKSVYLDLNGHSIGTDVAVTEGKTLYLMDSATAAYSVAEGYGKITGQVTGDVSRSFNTADIKASYGNHNYRYLILQDDNGYHAHRIYLAVKSTVLYPHKPAINYRTVLRCDSVVAAAVGANYGVKVSAVDAEDNTYGPESAAYEEVVKDQANDAKGNDRITALGDLLYKGMELTDQQLRTTSQLTACAYIAPNDKLGTNVESSGVTTTLKELVEAADGMTATLSASQQAALVKLYENYGDLMAEWNVENIRTLSVQEVEYRCLCNRKVASSACSRSGHKMVAWQKWERTDALPTTTGNYYLTGDVTPDAEAVIPADAFVCVDTKGYSIVSSGRVADVAGKFNLSNSAETESVVSGAGIAYDEAVENSGEAGILLIREGGNVSLYRGVNFQLAETHAVSKGGLISAYGSMNIYGATLTAPEALASGDEEFGGAVYVGTEGYLYSNGTIVGGSASKGGAIYAMGHVELDNGSDVHGGSATNGGNIFVAADGQLSIYGGEVHSGIGSGNSKGGNLYIAGSMIMHAGTIRDGVANRTNASGMGGNIYVDGGEVTVNSGLVKDGLAGIITYDENGEVTDVSSGWGGNIEVANGGALTINGEKQNDVWSTVISGGRTGGNGGSIRVGGNCQMIMNGGLIMGGESLDDQGGNLFSGGTTALNGGEINGGHAKHGGNIAINNGTLTLGSATVMGGTGGDGGNIRVNGAEAKLEVDAGLITGGDAANGGNIYINKGSFTMAGGTVENCTVAGNGGNINLQGNTTAEISGGNIHGGQAANGGNIYAAGNLTIAGGTIQSGRATKNGGNIYVAGTLDVSGLQDASGAWSTNIVGGNAVAGGNIYIYGADAGISGGRIANGVAGVINTDGSYTTNNSSNYKGGNICVESEKDEEETVTAVGSVEMTGGVLEGGYAHNGGSVRVEPDASFILDGESASMQGGLTYNNGGNLHVQGTFELRNGTVSGGSANAGGNIYLGGSDSSVIVSGGEVLDGVCGNKDVTKRNKDDRRANVFSVDGNLTLSGGHISGRVFVYSNSGQSNLTLTGAPVVDETGIELGHASYTEGEITKYRTISVTVGEMDADKAGVVLRYTAFAGDYAQGLKLNGAASEAIARKALKDYDSDCEITYEVDGIWIRPSTNKGQKWSCPCGANYGENHVNDCDGYDVCWREWTIQANTSDATQEGRLPTKPGYWYLTGSTTTKNDVTYIGGFGTNSYAVDYYLDEQGEYVPIYSVVAMDSTGNEITKADGKKMTVAEYRKINEGESLAIIQESLNNQVVAYVDADGNSVEGVTPVESYSVNIDLNGYKLQPRTSNRVITLQGAKTVKTTDSSTGEEVSYSTFRAAQVTINVIDASQGHTGGLGLYGAYSGGVASSGSQHQGPMIWMPYGGDSLNVCYTELNASSGHMGYGVVMHTCGNVGLYYANVIGGVAQGAVQADNKAYAAGGQVLKNGANGGGALSIEEGAYVKMVGGTISGGTSIYRFMSDDDGILRDSAVGGGNVYLNGGTFEVDGGTITGGKALIYMDNASTRAYATYNYGGGGGVYVNKGQLILKNGATITGNYSGIVSGPLTTLKEGVLNKSSIGTNFYNAVDMAQAVITAETPDNVFTGGNTIQLENLTGTVGFNMTGYEGAFATSSTDCTGALVCDEAAGSGYSYDANEGKVYYPVSSQDEEGNTLTADAVYMVGYGGADIQPADRDLQNGMIMKNYGNERDTAALYNGSEYSIVADSGKYFGTETTRWDTKLYVTALATTDGEGDTVLIISADASSLSENTCDIVKRIVSVATGVAQDHITISSEHQHSAPPINTVYYGEEKNGAYTDKDGNVLTSGHAIKTDYASIFYKGVVDAAVAAMNDRKQAAVTVGTLDTAAEGKQYNFVRNVVQKDKNGNLVGAWTDVHQDLYWNGLFSGWYLPGTNINGTGLLNSASITMEYESEVDTTMQLVQYRQVGVDSPIVMANFQTHPHLGSDGASQYVHSDIVGAFRHYLQSQTGSRVVYISGAGGDVNAFTKFNGEKGTRDDTGLYPYEQSVLTEDSLRKLQNADRYGQSLAALTAQFLSDGLTPVSGSNDVEVRVQTETFAVAGLDITDGAVTRLVNLYDWQAGTIRADQHNGTTFNDSSDWDKYVNFTNKADRIYSTLHAKQLRESLMWKESGVATKDLRITAYAMGDVGFVAAPYEMYQASGSAIKSGSAFSSTIVATQANGANGYIPTAEGYANGGYSADISNFAAGVGELLVEDYVGMLSNLHTQTRTVGAEQ